MQIEIEKATVAIEKGNEDKIWLQTTMYKSPINGSLITKSLSLMFAASEGTGIEYVEKVLKIEDITVAKLTPKTNKKVA